jgi:hypothetical protein
MKFSSEVFMAAVLGIFKSRKVVVAGGDVPLRILREDWGGVGLRTTDLAAGIEALVRSGVVIAVTTSSGLSFTLTPNGEDQISLRHGGLRSRFESFNTSLALQRLRRRRRGRHAAAGRREDQDRIVRR